MPSQTENGDFAANIERFTGFARDYDSVRPQPPALLGSLLSPYAGQARPECVVDLGSGTGLSTRYWADRAEKVIGIEPAAAMRDEAQNRTTAGNISYREALSHATGLPDGCADIVTCSQSLHWMEPQATFEEVKRILRPGGVFAAFDSDWPPVTVSAEAEAAYLALDRRAEAIERKLPTYESIRRWAKQEHLKRMEASGCFRFTREFLLHHEESGSAGRLIGLALSQGGIQTVLKAGISEEEMGLPEFRAAVQKALGSGEQSWLWSYRIRMGIV